MPQLGQTEIQEFITQVEEDARPRSSYYGLIFLSSVIATFGLLTNSAAVIIGAMLVAPLMNSIVGTALAVVRNEQGLLRRASFALVTGALLAWGAGLVLTLLSPVTEPGSEIVSRTRPTLFDLWVAVAAGLAGAYSLLRARSSAALPGVAIATALVPPLVASGIEARLLNVPGALGAMLLFVSNLVAIACGSMAVFIYYGLARFGPDEPKPQPLRRYAWWSGAFVVVLFVLAHSLSEVVREHRARRLVKDTLSSQFRMIRGATLDRFELKPPARKGEPLSIHAVVASPNSIGPPLVAAAERLLTKRLETPVHLVVRSVLTKDADAREYLLKEPPKAKPSETPYEVAERVLQEQALALEEADLERFSVARMGAGYRVTAVYRTPHPIDPQVIKGIQNLLEQEMERTIVLRLSIRRPEGFSAPQPELPAGPEPSVVPDDPGKAAAPAAEPRAE